MNSCNNAGNFGITPQEDVILDKDFFQILTAEGQSTVDSSSEIRLPLDYQDLSYDKEDNK